MARAFRRTARGVETRLDDAETSLVVGLVLHLRTLLDGDPTSGDEVLARLFPDGYRDDPTAAAELRDLIQPDLVEAKLAALDVISTSLRDRESRGRIVLDDEQAEQWLTGLNDLRLALGTRLGVTEEMYDDDGGAAARHDVEVHLLEVYDWLGWLQNSLVETLMASLDGGGSA